MNDQIIEQIYAQKYNTNTTSRKDIGDIYVDDIPINIKSTHIDRNNYSPNLVSADKLFDHLSNKNNKLQFLFVKYNDDNIIEENIVDAEHISWECLVIRCQGRGVIQMNKPLKVNTNHGDFEVKELTFKDRRELHSLEIQSATDGEVDLSKFYNVLNWVMDFAFDNAEEVLGELGDNEIDEVLLAVYNRYKEPSKKK